MGRDDCSTKSHGRSCTTWIGTTTLASTMAKPRRNTVSSPRRRRPRTTSATQTRRKTASSPKCSALNAWKRSVTSTAVGAMVHVPLVEQGSPASGRRARSSRRRELGGWEGAATGVAPRLLGRLAGQRLGVGQACWVVEQRAPASGCRDHASRLREFRAGKAQRRRVLAVYCHGGAGGG